jgi:hypothetical protein
MRGLGVTCGAPPLAQKRSVGVATEVIVEGSHELCAPKGLLVGHGGRGGRQEMGCMHSLSCSVPHDHDDYDEMKGVCQVRVAQNCLGETCYSSRTSPRGRAHHDVSVHQDVGTCVLLYDVH